MLPSSGLFKNTICPHLRDSSANCQRPYCHFLHTKNDNVIEHLTDSVIKDALLSKQFHNVLQQIESGVLQATEFQSLVSASEKPRDCHYNPTPISKLKNEQLDLHENISVYVPSAISDESKTAIKSKRKLSPKVLHYIPSICNNTQIEEKVALYTPSPSKKVHINDNTYEPKSANNQEVVKKTDIDYKPSCSANIKENENTYKPLNTNCNEHSSDNNKIYNPSLPSSSKSSNIYEPHGTSSSLLEYQPSQENAQANSPNILNEISNFSDDKQISIKKSKLDINHDNFKVETEDILNGNDKKPDSSKKHEKSKSVLNSSVKVKHKDKHKDKHSTKSEKKEKDDKNRNRSSKISSKSSSSPHHKNSNHHHKSSHSHKIKSESLSLSKSEKDSSKSTKHCDTKNSHQSKSKHDSKHRSSSKNSNEEKLKNKGDSNFNLKESKIKRSNDVIDKNYSSAHMARKVYCLFESDEELDHPVCSTDLKDPIVLECLKISEEYNSNKDFFKEESKEKQQKNVAMDVPEVTSTAKKRIAHSSAVNISRPSFKNGKKFTPATSFVERYKKILENQKQREFEECEKRLDELINSTNPISASSQFETQNCSISDLKSSFASAVSNRPTLSKPVPVRIAHIPKTTPAATPISMQTLKKGAARVAHVPNQNILKKLDATNLLGTNNSKIPSNVRLAYLNYITEACLEMHKNDVDKAHKMAQEEELLVAKKCMNIKVYKNSCLATILKIRKATKEMQTTSKNSNLNNDITTKRLVSGPVPYDMLSKSQKYNVIKKWILSEEDLEQNSYPLPTSTSGVARVLNEKKRFIPENKKFRQCSRCPKEYSVDDNGIPLVRDACIHHPRKCYKSRGRSTYGCCGLELGSVGCSAGDHVIEGVLGPENNLRTGFVQTLKKPAGHPANESIYALDCEMVYTTKGIELARITVVNDSLDVVYDRFVKPENYILDYATMFSGITADMLKDVTTTIFQVQAVLLNMFSDTTILIGHSLESDLKALKIIHKSVVDTSILFPHKAGLPFKRALKMLAIEHLQKIIQESTGGHDSAEDARITMELVLWKVKDSLKTQ